MALEIVKVNARKFDYSVGRTFRDQMQRAWATGATTVVLDFEDCVSIDSLGVSVLVAAHRQRPAGTRIVVCGLREAVREILEVTQLHRLFDVYATTAAVRQAA